MNFKFAFTALVFGIISLLNWGLYARSLTIEDPAHEFKNVVPESAIAFIAPILILLGLASIFSYFHEKSGRRIPFKEAVYKVSLASTPLAVNGIALVLWAYLTADWTAHIMNPFHIPLIVSVIASEALGLGVVRAGDSILKILGNLLIDYGLAWMLFFYIYGKHARIDKNQIWLVVGALVFIYIIALASHFLIMTGVSLFLLLIYKIRSIKSGMRSKILDYIEKDGAVHLRGLSRALNINRGTMNYHLNILEKFKMIKSSKFGRFKVFYSNSGHNGLYIDGTAEKILEYVRDNPDSTAGDIATNLRISPSSVSHHIKNLEEKGLIYVNRKGREIRVVARRT